jgi:hypothetical protein
VEYGRLIADSFRFTWRHRALWLFGVFVGGYSCNYSYQTSNVNSGGRAGSVPTFNQVLAELWSWFQTHAGLVAGLAFLLVLILVGFLVLSVISQGALVGAAARAELGERATFGTAWRAGLATFWRFLGLAILEWVASLVITLLFAPAVAFVVAAILIESSRALWIVLAVLAALLGLVLALPLWIALGIVFNFARRAVGAEARRAIEGIRVGYRLFRRRLGPTLLVWLINLGIGLALGIALLVLLVVLLIPLAIVFLILYLTLGGSPVTWIVVVILGLIVLALLLAASGAINTYTWTYWTFAYLRLRLPPAPELTPAL